MVNDPHGTTLRADVPTFLTLPPRTAKPRRSGITHAIDRGMAIRDLESLLDVAGAYLDVWKFGWGTAYLDPGIGEKLALLAAHGVSSCTGGTLFEVAWSQDAVGGFLDWAGQVGFDCVEVSNGVVPMTVEQKTDLVSVAARRFCVLTEVGAKDPSIVLAPATWAGEATAGLAAGARWVVTEGRESGTVGLFDANGAVRGEIVDAVVDAVGVEAVIFEAPRNEQQAWLIRRFGPDVNLANVAPADVLALESLRLGLRADTVAEPRSW